MKNFDRISDKWKIAFTSNVEDARRMLETNDEDVARGYYPIISANLAAFIRNSPKIAPPSRPPCRLLPYPLPASQQSHPGPIKRGLGHTIAQAVISCKPRNPCHITVSLHPIY